jgi:lysophospholipase L1-like esterase
MTPHNHAQLGAIADTAAFRSLSAAIAELFQRSGVAFVSYDRNPVIRTDMFLDLDHLTASGNQALADLLAQDLAQYLTKTLRQR